MNFHLSEEQITELLAGERGGEAGRHVRVCAECAAEVERTQKALLLFRDSGYQCAEYWQTRQRVSPAWQPGRWAIAGVLAAAVILAAVIVNRTPVREMPPAQEVFLRIPYVVPPAPYERTEVVRMDVPVAALIAAGIRMEALAGNSVSADVLVGQDGRPLAVGFPENK